MGASLYYVNRQIGCMGAIACHNSGETEDFCQWPCYEVSFFGLWGQEGLNARCWKKHSMIGALISLMWWCHLPETVQAWQKSFAIPSSLSTSTLMLLSALSPEKTTAIEESRSSSQTHSVQKTHFVTRLENWFWFYLPRLFLQKGSNQ